MFIFRIVNSRNILILITIMFALPAITQYISYVSRDKMNDYYNIFEKGEMLTIRVYYGNKNAASYTDNQLLYENKSIPYIPKKKLVDQNITFTVTPQLAKNQTKGYFIMQITPNKEQKRELKQYMKASQTAIHWTLSKVKKQHNLLKGENQTEVTKAKPKPIAYIYKTARFDIIYDDIANIQIIKPYDRQYYRFFSHGKFFLPPITSDDFYDIPTQRQRINLTEGDNITLNLEINIRKPTIWSMKNSYSFIMKYSKEIFYSIGFTNEILEQQFNEMKRIFIETDPLLLWTTGIATILHHIFSFLAFEKDLQFWMKKKSFRGVSMRTIVNQLMGDIIIFLYIADNETPLFMRILEFLNISLNLWKLSKLVRLQLRWPFIAPKDEYKENDEADSEGMKYLYYLMIPLIIIYSIYQLVNGEFNSVRSYLIHCLAGAIYSFGFLGMIPQLVVNYKLKTVAGMSHAALVFKFLNTFIDDLYTFVAKMPLMMKIACFRDDVIFFIWVFQCFIYETDSSRSNEYDLMLKPEAEGDGEEDEKSCDKKDEKESIQETPEKLEEETKTSAENEGKIE